MAENRGVDSELNFKAVALSAIVLLAVTAAAFVLMWGVAIWQKKRLVAQDPPPPVLAEARVRSLPAGVLLQDDPEKDLKILRAREDAVLSSWAWADPARTHARVPADRALEIVAAKGFPPRTAPPPAPEVKK
ncbi:MAG: hypothetical protein IPL89_17720 [Acidobacteria bacterium]|nr:hypothetical protein [Acidobacteriota bacterium]